MDAVLVFPPHWPAFQVYPSLPLLQGYLRSRGQASEILDANVQFHNYLLSEEFRASALTRLESRPAATQASRSDRQVSMAVRDRLEKGGRDAAVVFSMRAPGFHLDHRSRQAAIRTWDSYLQLVSTIYPTIWLNHRDLTVTQLAQNFTDIVRFCEDHEENIFLQYYARRLAQTLQAMRPSVVGIALVGPAQTLSAFTLCLLLKKILPSTHITLGGPYCSVILGPHSSFANLIGDSFDSVIEGRGELPLLELLLALQESRPPDSVAALTCRTTDGRLRRGIACTFVPSESRADFTGIDLGAYFYDAPIPMRLYGTAGFHVELTGLPESTARVAQAHSDGDEAVLDNAAALQNLTRN
ncbi:hypothetical protein [Methylocystis sp.]|uniref:hypothetical protein n=1 Tax=Methylocystis sp. TaxID=1911079 RepID=UPI003DA58976